MLNKLAAALIASVGLAVSPMTTTVTAAATFDDTAEERDFSTYWWVAMHGECAPGAGGRDWQSEIDFAGAPISRDLIFITQFRLGMFPRPGIHLFEREPERWQQHLDKIARDLEVLVPEDFTGLAVIDYERWKPVWERTRNDRNDQAPEFAEDHDFLLDWRDVIRDTRRDEYYSHGPDTRLQFVYDTYDEAATRFYLETIRECKRLRPNAQWSFFNFPQMRYHSPETPHRVIGYGDLTHQASRINDKMQAIFDEMDVIVPSIYPQQWTVWGNAFIDELPRNRQNRDRINEAFISSMVAEAARLGNGKPVYPIISLQYYMAIHPKPWLNEVNIHQAVEVSREAGASGLILWGTVNTEDLWNELQDMLYDRLSPKLVELLGEDSGDPDVADGADANTANGGAPGVGGDKSGGGGGTVLSGVITVDGN